MSSQEGVFSSRPAFFNGTNFIFWKVRMRAYFLTIGSKVWEIVKGVYQYPTSIPTDNAGKNKYEKNANEMNVILVSLAKS